MTTTDGRLLRWARRRAGMTQRELAQAVGMPQPSIARIEAGTVGARVATLNQLLRATGYELSVEPRRGADVNRTLIRARLAMAPVLRIRAALKGRGREPHQIRIMRRLRLFGVRFVLIGDLAAVAHGSPTLGMGLAICQATDRANREQLALADPGPDVELIETPPGTNGFADLDANATDMLVADGLLVCVAGLDDLIRMGPAEVELLGAVREELHA